MCDILLSYFMLYDTSSCVNIISAIESYWLAFSFLSYIVYIAANKISSKTHYT